MTETLITPSKQPGRKLKPWPMSHSSVSPSEPRSRATSERSRKPTEHVSADVQSEPQVPRLAQLLPTDARPAAYVQNKLRLLVFEGKQLYAPLSHFGLHVDDARAAVSPAYQFVYFSASSLP